jgi:hypothetical protein
MINDKYRFLTLNKKRDGLVSFEMTSQPVLLERVKSSSEVRMPRQKMFYWSKT